MSNYLDDCIQKITLVPNDTNRYLRLIRDLDKRIENVQAWLIPKQKQFIEKIRAAKEKKIDVETPEMQKEFAQIVKRQKLLIGFSKQKRDVARQLQEQIAQHTDRITKQLTEKNKDKMDEQRNQLSKKNKLKMDMKPTPKEQWYYNNDDPKYCYCGRPSSGEMVACQNSFCEKQWFHLDCVQEKNLPEKWYCADCRKLKDKTRNPIQKSYI